MYSIMLLERATGGERHGVLLLIVPRLTGAAFFDFFFFFKVVSFINIYST
jgi:hypothetical protein